MNHTSMLLALAGNSWAWRRGCVGGVCVEAGGGLWTEECVTSVWLSVQCLQETNFLSFFISGEKKRNS